MQTRFYVSHNGEEVGPFAANDILEKLKSRQLWSVDYVYIESKSDWITLEEFQTLHGGPVSAEPPPETSLPAPTTTVELAPEPRTGVVHLDELTPTIPTQIDIEPESVSETLAPQAAISDSKSTNPNPPVVASFMPELKLEKLEAKETKTAKKKTEKASVDLTSGPKGSPVQMKSGMVQLVNGVGVIDMTPVRAETVTLSLVDNNKKELKLATQPELQILSGQASQILIRGESKSVAGQSLQLQLEAHDAYGNLDRSFSGRVTVHVDGAARGGGPISFQNGHGQCAVTNNVAEKTTITLIDLPKGIEAPAKFHVTFVAGPAAQYVIESPKEVVAGQSVKLTVKAVDAFGNLATEASGAVELAVNGTPYSVKQVS